MLGLKKIANFALINGFESVRWSSSLKREFKEVVIKVPWGHIAGKWWEPYDKRPILTVHGWQDNCQSFDRLIPMLDKNVGYLTIDFPGHGYSSRVPQGLMYDYTIFILTFKSIVQSLNWPTVSLMGHSMGSVMACAYAMLFPKQTDFLICIDGLKPLVISEKVVKMAKAMEEFHKYNGFANDSSEPPSYTIKEIKDMLASSSINNILPEYTYYLMERNIAVSEIHPGKYYFTRDPRLKLDHFSPFSQDELVKLAENLKMPIFLVKATEASYYEKKENFYEVLNVIKRVSIDCDFHYVKAQHFVHLNNPEMISDLINNFVNRHQTQNRSEGSIKEDIIIDTKPCNITQKYSVDRRAFRI